MGQQPLGLHPRLRRRLLRRPDRAAPAHRGRRSTHRPIFFSVDEGIDQDKWDSVAVEWFRGINKVLGVGRTGVYGSSDVCAWAISDGVIGPSTTPGHFWAWQTKAWSNGEREPRAVLFQSVVVTASEPGVAIGNTHVDVDDVLAPDYGQWDLNRV